MTALAGSILLNSLIGIIFKLFEKYNINTVAAVVVNYATCVATGLLLSGTVSFSSGFFGRQWLPYAALLGCVFILVFICFAQSVRYHGIMVSSIFQKMSLIAPVLIGILVYSETSGWIKWAGICLSLAAIILANRGDKQESRASAQQSLLIMALPFLTFIGSCVVDSTLLVAEHSGIIPQSDPVFVTTVFMFAGLAGLSYMLLFPVSGKIQYKDIIAGIGLGIPNYFSIYLLVLALQMGVDGSTVFPVNNVSVLLIAGLAGMVFFGEKVSPSKIAGFIFALVAILLISLA